RRIACSLCMSMLPQPTISTLFPYTTLFRSRVNVTQLLTGQAAEITVRAFVDGDPAAEPVPTCKIVDLDGKQVDSPAVTPGADTRSEEHTSELQSREKLVCRLLLEKKKKTWH